MLESDKKGWLRSTLQIKGSVVPIILVRSIYFALFGLLISALYFFNLPVAQPVLGNVIPSIVLALLLVFRTNTAYERFWEGRELWGATITTINNLIWQIWSNINAQTHAEREKKTSSSLAASFSYCQETLSKTRTTKPRIGKMAFTTTV